MAIRKNDLAIYNSMSRQKETFRPVHPEMAGMYVCGPTVYGEIQRTVPRNSNNGNNGFQA